MKRDCSFLNLVKWTSRGAYASLTCYFESWHSADEDLDLWRRVQSKRCSQKLEICYFESWHSADQDLWAFLINVGFLCIYPSEYIFVNLSCTKQEVGSLMFGGSNNFTCHMFLKSAFILLSYSQFWKNGFLVKSVWGVWTHLRNIFHCFVLWAKQCCFFNFYFSSLGSDGMK